MTSSVASSSPPSSSKPWLKWLVLAVVVLGLVLGVLRAFKARQTKQAQAEQAAVALRQPTVFELQGADVVLTRTLRLTQTVPMSGTVRALNTAAVKAKVAGELQGLQVREGDVVKAGQVLARIDTTEYQARVQQADQQAQAAAAQVAIAQRTHQNNQALVQQQFISKTALDTSLANLEAAQASHRAALAAADVAKKSLTDTALRSPISGQVAARLVQNGERVGVDARVLEIVDLSGLELEVALPPADAALVQVGQAAHVEVEGLPEPVKATVTRISPSAQAASRSVMTYLKLSPTTGLRHGLFAKGSIVIGEREGVALPASSIRNDKPQPYVQVIVQEGDVQQIKHLPLRVQARGTLREADGRWSEPYVLTDALPEHTPLLRVTAGLMQEKTAVKWKAAASGAAQ
ncbi:MAG: hypothetical protein RLZZ612_1073 [Pseudomonadota bacterium]|jgi:RND family efflux transporter MFP subunit